MYSELVHIYGPFSIHSFGVMIALGLLLFVWLAGKHPLRIQTMSLDQFMDLITIGILCGVIGGRLLYVFVEWHSLAHWYDVFAVWQGGFSLLGTVIACGLIVPVYLCTKGIALLPTLDLIGIHAPLLQGVSRIGCFFAGCCYGRPLAGVSLLSCHPTQLYSACTLIAIFFVLRFLYGTGRMRQGQLFGLYLVLISGERFFVDFFRADQEFLSYGSLSLFSLHQWISILLCSIGIIICAIATKNSVYSRNL